LQEGIGAKKASIPLEVDSLTNHLKANDDLGKRKVLKMDVEGAEWDSLDSTPQDILIQFDQIIIELHGIRILKDLDIKIRVLQKLNENFYLHHIHGNNYADPPLLFYEG